MRNKISCGKARLTDQIGLKNIKRKELIKSLRRLNVVQIDVSRTKELKRDKRILEIKKDGIEDKFKEGYKSFNS